jgi:hypothetical protein
MSSFGFIVGDQGPEKTAAGGALKFAITVGEKGFDAGSHIPKCPACSLLPEPFTCLGLVPTPLSARAEEWLVSRLPEDIESVGGFLLRKAIGDFGYDGAKARELRKANRLAAPGPYERHYGPFFRRFAVSSEQILEELLCAGDIAPSHALAILMHLQAIEVDGAVPTKLEDGDKLGALVSNLSERKTRSKLALRWESDDEASVAALKTLLAALYAGFVLDADVFIFDSEGEPQS